LMIREPSGSILPGSNLWSTSNPRNWWVPPDPQSQSVDRMANGPPSPLPWLQALAAYAATTGDGAL